MADVTVESAKASISKAFESYIAELKQSGPHWGRKPTAGGEGEEAWCARQVAEHIASAGPYFGAVIAKAVGFEEPGVIPRPTAFVRRGGSGHRERPGSTDGRCQPAD